MTVDLSEDITLGWSSVGRQLFEHVDCPACGSERFLGLATNTADPFLATLKVSDHGFQKVPRASRWVVCRSCGLVLQNPRPTAEAIGYLYQGAFWGRPVETYARQGTRMFRSQFAWIVSAVRFKELPQGRPSRVLDIGCTTGKLLDHFKAAGWDTYGVEPDPCYAAYAARQGHRIEVGLFSEGSFPGVRFDLITASHVFEHIAEPRTFLGAVATHLDESRALFLEVPYIKRPVRDLWEGVFVSPHYYVYSERTLERVLAESGFRVERWAVCPRGLRVIATPRPARPGAAQLRDSPEWIVTVTAFHRYIRCPFLRGALAVWLAVTSACRFLLQTLLGDTGVKLYTALRSWFYR